MCRLYTPPFREREREFSLYLSFTGLSGDENERPPPAISTRRRVLSGMLFADAPVSFLKSKSNRDEPAETVY